MSWPDKDAAGYRAMDAVVEEMHGLHPIDIVETLRKVATSCNTIADKREAHNEQTGVPERAEDQE